MHKPVTMCAHRTLGNERQIVAIVIEQGETAVPYSQYAGCLNTINALKNVVGVSSQEDYTIDNFTLGDANGESTPVTSKANIICTFKTDNRAKYETIPLYDVTLSGASSVSTAINNAVIAVMTNPTTSVVSSYANWVLVSCVITIYLVSNEGDNT